jgi:vanillate O-demethylase ferredoxin subunit
MQHNRLSVRVAKRSMEALDICSFELVDVNDGPLPAFSAGSHVDVHLPNGMTRQYSLCNDPAERHSYLIAVLKDQGSRGGSKAMHELVNEGDTLTISPPKNHFPLAREARRSLLLAGGIGVTPILCMAERLAIDGAEFEMHYCTRSKGRTAFVERIQASAFASKVQFHFDDGAQDQRLDLAAVLAKPGPGTHLYVCGPKGFMDAVLSTARAQGWAEDQLHYEFFSAQLVKSDNDASFEVKLASSGRVVVVPKDKTVVQALAEAGIEVQTSCEQGVCGTCLTRVLEGELDHRDMFLTPEEQAKNDQFLPCCSRSKSARLVLDL